MTAPKVELLGDIDEAEKLRGFALSQLRILLDTMKFQGLKQYTRVVRFCDGSYVRAFSSFGIDTVTVFVPPVSVPEREVIEIAEGVLIIVEPCETALEIPIPQVTVDCTWEWVHKETGQHALDDWGKWCVNVGGCPSHNTETIVGNKKYSTSGGQTCVYTTNWWVKVGTSTPMENPPPCGIPTACGSGPCDCGEGNEGYCAQTLASYHEWECVP